VAGKPARRFRVVGVEVRTVNTAVIATAFSGLAADAAGYAEAVLPIALAVLAVVIGFRLVLKFSRRIG
jgi:hypothetical protein